MAYQRSRTGYQGRTNGGNYSNNSGTNNGPYNVTTKGLQFYNSEMEDEIDRSTLSVSFWKDNLLLSVNPMFTQEERNGLEEDDNRVYNYDVTMSIALNGKACYRLYKAILLLEKNSDKVKNVAIKTNSKVVKIGTGAEFGLSNWFVGVYNKDNADGLNYFFNTGNEDDMIYLNFDEETQKGSPKTINTELDILKEILKEACIMLSKGYAHEVRQEISNLKNSLRSNTTTSTNKTSTSSVVNRRRRTMTTDEDNQELESLSDKILEEANETSRPTRTAPRNNDVPVETLNDLSQLEDDFLDEGDIEF